MDRHRGSGHGSTEDTLDPLADLHARLHRKGPYVYQRNAEWWLADGGNHTPVRILEYRPAESAWAVPDDPDATYLLRFVLRREDLTCEMGDRIARHLATLQASGLLLAVGGKTFRRLRGMQGSFPDRRNRRYDLLRRRAIGRLPLYQGRSRAGVQLSKGAVWRHPRAAGGWNAVQLVDRRGNIVPRSNRTVTPAPRRRRRLRCVLDQQGRMGTFRDPETVPRRISAETGPKADPG